jgi:hypothetical protein
MSFPKDQIDELKRIAPNLWLAEEGGLPYILIKQYELPTGCQPAVADLLFCPRHRDGYESRLFFSQVINGIPPGRNWNGNLRALERNWCAMSWRFSNHGLRLAEIFLIHLKALR